MVPVAGEEHLQALKQLVYLREFLAPVSCPTSNRVHGSVPAFDCFHFDVVHRSVQVLVSDDASKNGTTKSTKGDKARAPGNPRSDARADRRFDGRRERDVGRLFPDREKDLPRQPVAPGARRTHRRPRWAPTGQFKTHLRLAVAGTAECPERFEGTDRGRARILAYRLTARAV